MSNLADYLLSENNRLKYLLKQYQGRDCEANLAATQTQSDKSAKLIVLLTGAFAVGFVTAVIVT